MRRYLLTWFGVAAAMTISDRGARAVFGLMGRFGPVASWALATTMVAAYLARGSGWGRWVLVWFATAAVVMVSTLISIMAGSSLVDRLVVPEWAGLLAALLLSTALVAAFVWWWDGRRGGPPDD